MNLIQFIDQKYYQDYTDHWDDKLFRKRLLQYIGPNSTVLDVGAGAGIVREMNFKDIAKQVCGIDPDERVVENPYLHEAHVGLADNIPYPDSTFDVVFADNVLEHLPNPHLVFTEIRRVLKPGGVFLAKTPNSWHYMPVISRITPLAFHRYINKIRGREVEDTFPTCYAANSHSAINQLSKKTGFTPVFIERHEGRPEYLRMLAITYVVGMAYERIVNAFNKLERFRILLIICLRKPES